MHPRHAATVAAITLAVLVLGGCASPRDNAIFATRTSLSIIDAESTPASVSIAYDRAEGYLGPRLPDGSVYPVFGLLETDGGILFRYVRQTYAGGCAAQLVTLPKGSPVLSCPPPLTPAPGASDDRPILFFATSTTLGLKMAFQTAASASVPIPESFTLGYKRKEASIIPVDAQRQPSVLASVDTRSGAAADSGGTAGAAPSLTGPGPLQLTQFFATGLAAENLARDPDVVRILRERATSALTDVQTYRLNEAAQGRLALDTVACLAQVPDPQLGQVWNNAEALGIFTDRGPALWPQLRAAGASAAAQRKVYTGHMAVLVADSKDYTQLLDLHRKAVCGLASVARSG